MEIKQLIENLKQVTTILEESQATSPKVTESAKDDFIQAIVQGMVEFAPSFIEGVECSFTVCNRNTLEIDEIEDVIIAEYKLEPLIRRIVDEFFHEYMKE